MGLIESSVFFVGVPEAVDFGQQEGVLLLQVQVLTVQNLFDGLVFREQALAFVDLGFALYVFAFSIERAGLPQIECVFVFVDRLVGEVGEWRLGFVRSGLFVEERLGAGGVVGGVFGL